MVLRHSALAVILCSILQQLGYSEFAAVAIAVFYLLCAILDAIMEGDVYELIKEIHEKTVKREAEADG